jgi:acyl phosphate:glycerol-3-phosphate acyltransferase
MGGALIIAPLILALVLPLFLIVIALTRISSLGSLSASAAGGALLIVLTAVVPLPPIYYVYGLGVTGLIWLFHLDNIGRLLAGKERHIG